MNITGASKTTRIAVISGLIVGLLLMLNGCGDEEIVPPAIDSPYAGSWRLVFDDYLTGVGVFEVGLDGKSSLKMTFTDGNTFANYTVSFAVDNNGQMLNGEIHDLESQVGTIAGQFSEDSGSGSFEASQPDSGAWLASRQ